MVTEYETEYEKAYGLAYEMVYEILYGSVCVMDLVCDWEYG